MFRPKSCQFADTTFYKLIQNLYKLWYWQNGIVHEVLVDSPMQGRCCMKPLHRNNTIIVAVYELGCLANTSGFWLDIKMLHSTKLLAIYSEKNSHGVYGMDWLQDQIHALVLPDVGCMTYMNKCTLLLTSEDSAKSLVVAALSVIGQECYGFWLEVGWSGKQCCIL